MGQNHNIDHHYLLNRLRSGSLSDPEKEDLQTYIRHTVKDESLTDVLKIMGISTKIKTRTEKREVYMNSRN